MRIGAGKTTAVRTLGTLIAPTWGSAAVTGIALAPENGVEIRRRISIMPESPGLYLRLSVTENLACFADLCEVPDAGDRIDRALRAVRLADRAGDACGALSKGLRQRVALARALLSDTNPPRGVPAGQGAGGFHPVGRDLVCGPRLLPGLRGALRTSGHSVGAPAGPGSARPAALHATPRHMVDLGRHRDLGQVERCTRCRAAQLARESPVGRSDNAHRVQRDPRHARVILGSQRKARNQDSAPWPGGPAGGIRSGQRAMSWIRGEDKCRGRRPGAPGR
jgi:ABC transporter